MANHVVIMAGGIGSRFWPISTPEYPKQFIDILGIGRSLLQLTYDRFVSSIIPNQNVWVVTNAKYVDIVQNQLPNIPHDNILAEPTSRNTAPCIAWACWSIRKKDSCANVVVTPADAIVMNTVEFNRVIENSLHFTEESNSILTIGIKPTRPETGYGYVQAANIIKGEIHRVIAFKEKPNYKTAQAYLALGNFLWNAGIFVWNVNTITNAIIKYKPTIAEAMDKIIATGDIDTIFPTCEKISIDYAVIEPAAVDGCVYTHPASFGWSDLGNWQSLHEIIHKDKNHNSATGNVHLFECYNCVIHAENAQQIILQGLDNYIVAEKNGRFLVCRRSAEQHINEFSTQSTILNTPH